MVVMTASDIMDAVPPSVQILFLAIGVICLVKKIYDWTRLVSSFILPGTNVRADPPLISFMMNQSMESDPN